MLLSFGFFFFCSFYPPCSKLHDLKAFCNIFKIAGLISPILAPPQDPVCKGCILMI